MAALPKTSHFPHGSLMAWTHLREASQPNQARTDGSTHASFEYKDLMLAALISQCNIMAVHDRSCHGRTHASFHSTRTSCLQPSSRSATSWRCMIDLHSFACYHELRPYHASGPWVSTKISRTAHRSKMGHIWVAGQSKVEPDLTTELEHASHPKLVVWRAAAKWGRQQAANSIEEGLLGSRLLPLSPRPLGTRGGAGTRPQALHTRRNPPVTGVGGVRLRGSVERLAPSTGWPPQV